MIKPVFLYYQLWALSSMIYSNNQEIQENTSLLSIKDGIADSEVKEKSEKKGLPFYFLNSFEPILDNSSINAFNCEMYVDFSIPKVSNYRCRRCSESLGNNNLADADDGYEIEALDKILICEHCTNSRQSDTLEPKKIDEDDEIDFSWADDILLDHNYAKYANHTTAEGSKLGDQETANDKLDLPSESSQDIKSKKNKR